MSETLEDLISVAKENMKLKNLNIKFLSGMYKPLNFFKKVKTEIDKNFVHLGHQIYARHTLHLQHINSSTFIIVLTIVFYFYNRYKIDAKYVNIKEKTIKK